MKNGTLASPAIALGEQRLAGAGRADHQHAARNLAAELLELARVLQEVDDLADFFLGFVDAGHVGERDVDLVLVRAAARGSCRTTWRPAPPAAALHLAHEVDPDADQQQDRERGNEQLHQERLPLRRRRAERDAVLLQRADQRGVVGFGVVDDELLAARAHAVDLVAAEGDLRRRCRP